MADSSRQKEIRDIHRTYKWFYVLMGISIVLAVGIYIGAAVFADDPSGYAMNLVTEAFGVVISIAITVLVIDRIYEQRAKRELRNRLVREAGSRSNDIAISAVEWLRREEWLSGNKGILQDEDLNDANLQGAPLDDANLQRTFLQRANLQNATLIFAQMQEARLQNAKLQGARLYDADLQGAKLINARLQGAKLLKANLREADFHSANLHDANLLDADLQEAKLRFANLQGARLDFARLCGALLPDGEQYNDNVDMNKFTNPEHPDFFDYSERLRKYDEISKFF